MEAAVRSAMEQSRPAEQILVVDDGGSEDLAAILGAWPDVRILRQANRGLAAARNSGLAAATSDKVIFLDADDRLLPNAIAAGLTCFAQHPSAAFVYGGYEDVAAGERETRFTAIEGRSELLRSNRIGMIATVMFDRRILLSCGGFDERLNACEDWDAYLRLSRCHEFTWHAQTIAEYQRHDANMSSDALRMIRGHVEIFDRLVRDSPAGERSIVMKERSRWLARQALVLLRRGRPAESAATMFSALKSAPVATVQETARQLATTRQRLRT